jgi:hypothetical protein
LLAANQDPAISFKRGQDARFGGHPFELVILAKTRFAGRIE